MAVTQPGRDHDALCGKTSRASAVATAVFVEFLTLPGLALTPARYIPEWTQICCCRINRFTFDKYEPS